MQAVAHHHFQIRSPPWPDAYGTVIDSALSFGKQSHAAHGLGLLRPSSTLSVTDTDTDTITITITITITDIVVIEGDHGLTVFHPNNAAAREATQCQVELQKRAGGNVPVGRQLHPSMVAAGLTDVHMSPRMVCVDASRPDWAEGFTRNTFTATIQGVRKLRWLPVCFKRGASMKVCRRCCGQPNQTVFFAKPS